MDSFKVLLFFVGWIAVVLTATKEEIIKDLLTKSMSCKKEHGVTDAEAILAQISKSAEIKENMKCMLNCIMIKMDVLSPEGEINDNALVQNFQNVYSLDEVKAAEYSKICIDQGKAVDAKGNPCEVATVLHSCSKELKEKYGLHHIMFY